MNYPIILALNLTKNPQNRHFCAFLGSGTLVFGHFEHKIEVFVRFLPSGPPFLALSSTKSAFLCSERLHSDVADNTRQFYRWGDAAAEALNR